MLLSEFREKYPEYKEVPDYELAQGLHQKFYSDMDFGEFSKQIGLSTDAEPAWVAEQEAYEDRPTGEVVDERLSRGMSNLRSSKAMEGATDVASRYGDLSQEYGMRPTYESDKPLQRSAISARPGEVSDAAGRPLISETGETWSGDERVMGEALSRERDKIDRLIQLSNTEAAKASKIPMAPVAREAFKAKTFGEAWDVVKQAPGSFIAEVGTSSLPMMAEPLLKASIGSALGGPWLGMVGMAQGSYNVDYAAELRGELERNGVDINDVASVRRALLNPELMNTVRGNARAHASMVALMDGLSFGIASKTLVPKIISGMIARQVVNVPIQTGVQGGLGGLGEGLGQLAAGRELEPGEIVAEIAGEAITAPIDVVTATLSGAKQQRLKTLEDQLKQMADEANAAADTAPETELEAREQEMIEAEAERQALYREAFDAYEKQQAGQKQADEDAAYAELNKNVVEPAALEDAPQGAAEAIDQSLDVERKERAISGKPKSAMEAAFEQAKGKKYGLNVDEAADQAATSPNNDIPQPTQAQKEAGNYKKGHVKVQGLDIAIENPRGSQREGVDPGGQPWSQTLNDHYGYVKRTQGADNEQVDVFLGPEAETAETFYVVNQNNPQTGQFDEHKVMIGYPSQEAAEAAYLSNYQEGWQGMGDVVPLTKDQFQRFLTKGKLKQPLSPSANILLSKKPVTVKRVYHGTLNKFDTKDIEARTPVTKAGNKEATGIYFTPDAQKASGYARGGKDVATIKRLRSQGKGPRIIAADLTMNSPLNITSDIKNRPEGMSFSDAKRKALEKFNPEVHDGVIFEGDEYNSPEYMVMNASQVKEVPLNEKENAKPKAKPETKPETKPAKRVTTTGPTLASPVPLSRLNDTPIPDIYGKFGELKGDVDTTEDLMFYNLEPLLADPSKLQDMLKRYGFKVEYFAFHNDPETGVEFRVPKLKKEHYGTGTLWIYDPRVAHASFKDIEYTRQWRIVHELGHALTEKIMQKKYGDSRREGRMGQLWDAPRGNPAKRTVDVTLEPITLKEAQRAIEWEDVAFRVQRILFEELGVDVGPEVFAQEYNTNIADATYRILTGDFGDPGEYGFVPRGTLPSLKGILQMLENTENAMAREQGRKPTKGINLDTYERVSLPELKQLVDDAKRVNTRQSVGTGKKGGMPVSRLQDIASRMMKAWKQSPEIIVVESSEQAPERVKMSLREQGSMETSEGTYVVDEGVVYIYANKIPNEQAMMKVILHEVMGHHGLRAVMGENIDPFLEEVYRANRQEIERYAEDYYGGINAKNRLIMAEEFLAVNAETNPDSTLVSRAISKIMQWLRQYFPSMKLSQSELREVLAGMRKTVQSGQTPIIARDIVEQIRNNIRIVDDTAPTIANAAKRWLKREMTKEGLLNDESFEAKIQSDSLKKAGEEDLSFMVARFEKAMQQAFGVPYDQIPDDQLALVDQYLKGEKVNLPESLKGTLNGMRNYLDRLSLGMQKALTDMMKVQMSRLNEKDRAGFEAYIAGEPDGYLPPQMQKFFDLYQTIQKNMGTYMTRSYEAFDNPKWKDRVLKNKDLIARAEEYIAERNPDLTPDEVVGAVRAILQAAKDKSNFLTFLSSGTKYGKKDVSILNKRKDVPDVIRELLGEYQDPRVNFARSATKMYMYLANHEFLMNLRNRGLGYFLYERPTGKFDKQIAATGTETLNPIDGLYTTEDFVKGLEDMKDPIEGGSVMRAFIRMNSAVKYGKTILAPTTQARNFMSASMFSIMNGHFNWASGAKAFRVAQSDLFTKDVKWRSYLNNLIMLGVLHDNPRAEELRHALEDFMEMEVYSKTPTRSLKRFLNFMQRVYQIGDDFWKIIGFENEVQMQMRAGKNRQQAEKLAAFRIRNGYPTYSMVPRAIKRIRRWPLIGTFVSFPYEIVRTSANQMKFLMEDVNAGNNEMAARRVLGMAMAVSVSATLSYLSMLAMGLDGDDDEAVRALSAPWQRNSQLVYTGYDESGYPKYLDFSYFDPYTYLKKPITAILNKNNEGIDKKVIDALREFLEPFIGVDIAAGALMEIYSNKRADTGTQIYNPEAPTDEIAMDMINHFRKAAQPGVVANAERMVQAIRGETSPSGKEYKIEDEAAALVGFRMGTLNVPQSVYYKTLEFKDIKSQASQQLSKVVGSGSSVTESQIKRGFNGMMLARKKAYTQMVRMVEAAEKLGVPKGTIRNVLKAAKVGDDDIRYIMAGRIPRWTPSKVFMDNAMKRSLATADKDKRQTIRKDFYARKKYVYELMREQESYTVD